MRIRGVGVTTPICAGGGIGTRREYPKDIRRLKAAGANMVSIGSGELVRPQYMKGVIECINEVF